MKRIVTLTNEQIEALIYVAEDVAEVYLTEDDPAIQAHGEVLIDLGTYLKEDLEDLVPWIVVASNSEHPITPACGPFDDHDEARAWAMEVNNHAEGTIGIDIIQLVPTKKEHQ